MRHLLKLSLICRKTDDPVANHFYSNNLTVENFYLIGFEKH
jgi:hypothetical protein